MLNNEVKEIAFEIAKKFKVSFDYQYKGEETEIYSFTDVTKGKTFGLYTDPNGIEFSVYVLDFDSKGDLRPFYSEATRYGEVKSQSFLKTISYLLEISNTWGIFIDRLYSLS